MYKKANLRLSMTLMAVLTVLPSCSSNDTGSAVAPVPEKPSVPQQEVLTEADPTIFVDTDGTYYLYGTGSNSDTGFYVYRSADMKTWQGPVGNTNGFCLTGATSYGTTGFWAPQVVKRGDTYYMFYSANDFRNIDYAVGVATASSPFGPWTKSSQSVINRANIGYYGTGHGDMFKDAQGQWNYVFHTHNSFTEVRPRKTAVVGLSQTSQGFAVTNGTFHYLYKE